MRVYQKQLVIDTATKYLYIGLFDGAKALEEIYQEGENDHSATLMDCMSNIFEKHSINPQEIDRIIVGQGPGSYTGIRVGIVVAKILAWSLAIPVFTVSSLALIASAAKQPGRIVSLIDARRGAYFYGTYELSKHSLTSLSQDSYGSGVSVKETMNTHQCVEFGKPEMDRIFASNLLSEVTDIHLLTPVYLRKTEAEHQLNKHKEGSD